jgi:RNA polymerase sigma-70 factor, ECF subfamily
MACIVADTAAPVWSMTDQFGNDLIAMLPRLRRFALSLCRRRDVADDLVQLACEKALANAASYQTGTRFDAWLFRILRNGWIDQVRRNRTMGPTDDVYEREDLTGVQGVADMEAKLTLQKVWAIIGELPEDQREVLLLVCVEGLSYKEAADVLGIPVGTVMSRLSRARIKVAGEAGIDGGVAR